jgi:hypothetical protein
MVKAAAQAAAFFLDAFAEFFFRIGEAVLFKDIIRNALPGIGNVAHVAHVFDTDGGSIEAGGRQVSHQIEERNALGHFGFGFFWVSDVIHYLDLLRLSAILKGLTKPVETLHVQPAETAAQGSLVLRKILYNEFDEFGHFGVGGATAYLIPGDDDIAEDGNGGYFLRGEKGLSGDILHILQLFFHAVETTWVQGVCDGGGCAVLPSGGGLLLTGVAGFGDGAGGDGADEESFNTFSSVHNNIEV